MKESGLSFYLHAIRRSLKYMKGKIILFDYPLIPSFIVSRAGDRSLRGVCLVLSRPIHNNPMHPKNVAYRTFLLLGRPWIDLFTGITPHEAAEIGRLVGKEKVTVLPSPLAPEFLRPPEDCERTLRECFSGEALSLLLGREVILYHGVLDERRGLSRILGEFVRAFPKGDPVLAVLGKGPALPSVLRYQSKFPSVRYLGAVPLEAIPCILKYIRSGIAWLPNEPRWRYQLPTKVLELMAMGKPFLTSRLPGIAWAVGDCPLAFYSEDISLLSIRDFWMWSLEVRDVSGICRERAESFSANAVASNLWRHLEHLI